MISKDQLLEGIVDKMTELFPEDEDVDAILGFIEKFKLDELPMSVDSTT